MYYIVDNSEENMLLLNRSSKGDSQILQCNNSIPLNMLMFDNVSYNEPKRSNVGHVMGQWPAYCIAYYRHKVRLITNFR